MTTDSEHQCTVTQSLKTISFVRTCNKLLQSPHPSNDMRCLRWTALCHISLSYDEDEGMLAVRIDSTYLVDLRREKRNSATPLTDLSRTRLERTVPIEAHLILMVGVKDTVTIDSMGGVYTPAGDVPEAGEDEELMLV